jgi:hypothetical protein
MTTPWTITPDWKGETVAVLASGPSMSAGVAQSLRNHRTIVVNATHQIAPWADMLVALDHPWREEFRQFVGLRVAGFEDEELDALYAGPFWNRVQVGNASLEFRNSGLAAIRIAAAMGASRIILAGFEPENQRRWYDNKVDHGAYVGLRAGIEQLRSELTAAGVVLEGYIAPADAAEPARKRKQRLAGAVAEDADASSPNG